MRLALLRLCLVPVLACSACAAHDLNFKVDDRVKITSPRDEAEVSLPLTLRWSVEDFEVVEPGTQVREEAGYFGVFVDTTPMSPGQNLDVLRRDDERCDGAAGCTEESLLAARGIYATTDTELVITSLPVGTADDEKHRATVVLLDSRGTRIGESAWRVDFTLPDQEEEQS